MVHHEPPLAPSVHAAWSALSTARPLLTSAGASKINPWRYNSSNPRYNPKSFDLWIDVIAGGKTNRICNWSDKPITVYYTSIATSYP